jgi:hypothetical protein
MPTLDTRLDWEAIEAAASGRAMVSATLAPWELLTHPSDPRERLSEYLNTWAGMDEFVWPEANVRALYEDIMDVFEEHPEANVWFREWRATNPKERLS